MRTKGRSMLLGGALGVLGLLSGSGDAAAWNSSSGSSYYTHSKLLGVKLAWDVNNPSKPPKVLLKIQDSPKSLCGDDWVRLGLETTDYKTLLSLALYAHQNPSIAPRYSLLKSDSVGCTITQLSIDSTDP